MSFPICLLFCFLSSVFFQPFDKKEWTVRTWTTRTVFRNWGRHWRPPPRGDRRGSRGAGEEVSIEGNSDCRAYIVWWSCTLIADWDICFFFGNVWEFSMHKTEINLMNYKQKRKVMKMGQLLVWQPLAGRELNLIRTVSSSASSPLSPCSSQLHCLNK